MTPVWVIVGYGFREAVRRKMFAVVVILTVAFLFLFWLANHYVFRDLSTITPPRDVNVDTRTFAGAFLVGLSMFATLFLGVVLAVFLTLGAGRAWATPSAGFSRPACRARRSGGRRCLSHVSSAPARSAPRTC